MKKLEIDFALIGPSTQRLIAAVMLDAWPNHTTIVDFGIDSQRHYEALYYPIRAGEIEPLALHAAMGNGKKLTELLARAPSNPHKDIRFHTSWDIIHGRGNDGREEVTRETGRRR